METKLTKEEQQKIESYILEELNPTESKEWASKIENNIRLKEEYERQKIAIDTLVIGGRQAHKQEMKAIHQELYGNQKETTSKTKWVPILLVLLLVSAASIYYFTSKKVSYKSTDDIYLAYYEPIKLSTQRSNNAANIDFHKLYESKQYEALLALEDTSLDNNPEYIMARGHAALNTKDYDKAITHFNRIIESKNMYYTEPAKWFLGLTKLKSGAVNEAKSLFQTIVNNQSGDYKNQAQEILSELEKVK